MLFTVKQMIVQTKGYNIITPLACFLVVQIYEYGCNFFRLNVMSTVKAGCSLACRKLTDYNVVSVVGGALETRSHTFHVLGNAIITENHHFRYISNRRWIEFLFSCTCVKRIWKIKTHTPYSSKLFHTPSKSLRNKTITCNISVFKAFLPSKYDLKV